MSDKESAIAELEQKYVAFRDVILSVPPDAYGETFLGEWSVNQVLAHMAGWYREMAPAFGRVAAGERPAPPDANYGDADGWNVKFVADSKEGQVALDDFDEAFHEYYAAAKALDEAHYGMDPEKGRPRIGNRLLEGAGTHHFDEHRPHIEDWLRTRV